MVDLHDPVVQLNLAFKMRPVRDGGGKPSMGRLPPSRRPRSSLGALGAAILALSQEWIEPMKLSLSCGEKQHPFPESLLSQVREVLGSSPEETPPSGQPLYLQLMGSLARQSGDPDHEFPALLAGGVPLGVTSPTLTSPGVWPLKSELSGEDPAPEALATPIGRANCGSMLSIGCMKQAALLHPPLVPLAQ